MFINCRVRTLSSEAVFCRERIGHLVVLCVSSTVFSLFYCDDCSGVCSASRVTQRRCQVAGPAGASGGQ